MSASPYDVVIVGGGAAGLSAALVLGRARRRVAVVDAGSPRNAPAEHMQGFLSRDGMPPADFLAAGRAEVARYGVELIADSVVGVETGFVARLTGGRVLEARRVLIATGVRDELPDIPGVPERWGRDLLHCPYCHGWEVRDQKIGVLGTRPDAVQHALLVRQWSDDVVFFAHTLDLSAVDLEQLEARGVRVVTGVVASLVIEADLLTGVALADGQVIPRTAVFIRPNNVPHADGLLAGLGCEVDAAGFSIVDATGRTSIQGVWAAGNVVDPRVQVITSAGAGSAAAIAINADLVGEDVERARGGGSLTTAGAPNGSSSRATRRKVIGLGAAVVLIGVVAIAVNLLWDPSAIRGSFDVGGRSLYLECVGEGSPTVVMEAGSGGDHTSWEAVVAAVRGSHRTCTYDRANTGASSPVTGVRKSSDVVADLHVLLDTADIPPPYILVGHSLGGISTRLFAATHADEVVGVVLVDATPTTFVEDACAVVDAAQCAIFRSDFQPEHNDWIDIADSSAAIAAAAPLSPMPFVVLAANDHGHDGFTPELRRDFEAMWLARQREVADSVEGGRLEAVDSSHNIQSSHPELVIAAISDVAAELAAATP